MEMFFSKHLEAHDPLSRSLDTYPDRPPELVSVDLKEDTVI